MEQLLERINKAPNAVKFGGLAAVLAAITAANFFLLVQPEEEKIEQQKATQNSLNNTLAEKQEIAQNLNEKRKEMDQLEQQLIEALTKLPEKKDIDELLAQLNDVGKKSGLEITRVTPGGEAPAGFISRIPIQMSVVGNYHEIALFLQEISNMRRIVNVNNIQLTNPTLRNEKVVLSSNFLATTFRFVDQGGNSGNK